MISLAQHIRKKSNILVVMRLLKYRRPISKDIWLWGMPMKVYKNLYSFSLLFFTTFEVFQDSHYLWKHVISQWFFINIPVSIKIMTQNTCTIIPHFNTVDINHRNNNPKNITLKKLKPIDKAFHHPASNSFSRMLPSHHNYCSFCVLIFIY